VFVFVGISTSVISLCRFPLYFSHSVSICLVTITGTRSARPVSVMNRQRSFAHSTVFLKAVTLVSFEGFGQVTKASSHSISSFSIKRKSSSVFFPVKRFTSSTFSTFQTVSISFLSSSIPSIIPRVLPHHRRKLAE